MVFVCASGPIDLRAQDTRAEVIAQQQAKKARDGVAPDGPSFAERLIGRVWRGETRQRGGFVPLLGSVYGGGGFTLGAGYRRYPTRDTSLNLKGLYSVKNYKLIEVGIGSPGRSATRLPFRLRTGWREAFRLRAGWRDATQVGYYGLGMDTSADDRANYRFQEAYAGVAATYYPLSWIVLAGGTEFENYSLLAGQGSEPTIDTRYTSATAPGLGDSPSFLHSEGTAGIDWRTSPGYSRSGGYYAVTYHDYFDPDHTYSFSRLDADAVQHLPILRETWVVSLRARTETTIGDDDVVPYFMLPYLGSGRTLRAYSFGRFRDRNSILTSAEWRWIPNRTGFDMAIFYDAGKVTSQPEDLNFDGLAHNWGVGARFHGPAATLLRIELARGSDGWHTVFSGNAAF
ncbi:MAG: hypothetical protein ACRD3C_04385 [Vicinamibacterales bacterium]